jgi:2-amino-4-hydroxy-6-hydroxymethyldihydropteridine diphosphokinase
MRMVQAYVGMGGNVGDVAARFAWAELELGRVGRVRMSSLWRSAPIGPVPEQPWFLNACAELTCALEARALLGTLLTIEAAAGRDRARELPQGPRVLDLDLLLYGDAVLLEPDLVVPHPRLAERAFALAPLEELTGPDRAIPGSGRVAELLTRALRVQTIAKIV